MGKIRTRTLGLEEVEQKQKKEQKVRSEEKKIKAKKEEPMTEKQAETTEKITKATPKLKKIEEKKAAVKLRGKKYQEIKKLVDVNKKYTLEEAVSLLKKMKSADFDESVELHLNIDQAGLKGEVTLAHSTGKNIRIKIVDDKVIEAIGQGKIDFDMLITHPSFMPKLAKFAKVLGPKGLMPNPKAGTISPKPEEVAKKFEKGAMRWKAEAKFPLIHQMIGKISFSDNDIIDNAKLFLQSVGKSHIQKAFIKLTMSPSVKLDLEKCI
jgi:large subunit ribosomal protein L1